MDLGWEKPVGLEYIYPNHSFRVRNWIAIVKTGLDVFSVASGNYQ